MLQTSVLRGSTAGGNRLVQMLMAGLQAVPGHCPGAVEAEVVGHMTASLAGSAGGTRCAPGDDGLCPVKC